MQKTISAELDAPPERIRAALADLATYPEWLEIVTRAEPTEGHESDTGPAWLITLRAKVGPFSRSKRLRMVRVADEVGHIRFERNEIDDREHANWVLDVTIDGDQPCPVTVELHYGGGLWSKPLETILGGQIDDAVPRLQALVGPV